MASFIKNLFDKKKEKKQNRKYGEGHKLGSAATYYSTPSPQTSRPQSSTSPSSQVTSSEASQRAGQAAVQRLEAQQHAAQNAAKQRKMASLAKNMAMQDLNKEKEVKDKETTKALELKKHYFGDNQIVLDGAPMLQKVFYRSDLLGPHVRYPRDEIDNQIEQALLCQLEQEPILASTTLLFTAHRKTPDKLKACVEILNKFVQNILGKPDEPKYRKIRVENKIFKEKVYNCKYADLVLKKTGFTAESLSVTDDSEEKEDFFVYRGEQLDKLESLASALSLAEPIVPEMDRDLKCFRISKSSSVPTDKFQLHEEFYNRSVDELRKEQKVKAEALEKSGMLRTKAMRDRDEQLELRRYNFCLIRVKFPNDYMLQCLFRATETYNDLYMFLEDCLETGDSFPFELFSHTLKSAEKASQGTSSMAQLNLAPASCLNFRWSDLIGPEQTSQLNKTSLLKSELIQSAIETS